MAFIYAQVTVNDLVIARYTADAWRGRVYAVRYFLTFLVAGVAVSPIAFLHGRGGFDLVLRGDGDHRVRLRRPRRSADRRSGPSASRRSRVRAVAPAEYAAEIRPRREPVSRNQNASPCFGTSIWRFSRPQGVRPSGCRT